ncbi:selenide, water dikinase SelD [Coprobacillus sp. AF33-1AC]|uniref:selenide, water dikinase SelD n=1 Tax=Coprobacillus sp. AF33-1AC TaxID=2292032 RepID=UPI000E48DEC0|nr:selenide, water dikinase SelD [Coprobacillus sp. AF33-1AC]RHM63614.1 selenide, water dikinase SelD [Coprobacillus sp. AF33-1AC]
MKDKLYCKSGGCSAKLGAKKLRHILEKIDKYPSDQLLVGFDSHDDGAVYQINEHQAIVSTLDFFPPMVEDPYLFGQIAATNALSDIYAMGGTPLTALNIVCFNDHDDLNILGKIIEGGNDKLKEAHVTLAGGHSIRDESTKYGLSVTGMVDPHRILSNKDVQENDVLILTKKLGVGLTLNAARLNDASKDMLDEVYQSMTLLNKYAYDLLKKYRIHALTDVTGFGLLVHLDEMLNHQKSAVIDKNKIPYFKDCPYYVNEFYLTGAAQQNRHAVEDKVYFDKENFILEEILYDPQTSGGLLASVQEEDVDMIIEDFKKKGYQCYIIGKVIKKDQFDIYVR